MKIKPILIGATGVLLLAGIFFYVRSTPSNPQKKEIIGFLNNFNNKLKQGNSDTLLTFFDKDGDFQNLPYFIDILTGKDINGKIEPLFKIDLKIDDSKVKFLNQGLSEAKLKVVFSKDGVASKETYLSFIIKRTDFFTAYYAYKKTVLGVYHYFDVKLSPTTLASFKQAELLKARYDSVIWFAYTNNKTFFYVIKGKWDIDKDLNPNRNHTKDSFIEPYKMGLVNPDLKEIIPPEYDLIHNISGTFPGLIEVEKGDKKGFYNLEGTIIIPVNYKQIFPIEDDNNLAVLKDSLSYYYLKKDMTISEKVDLKLTDFFPKIKNIGSQFDLYKNALSVVTEYNSRYNNGAVYLPPSYLVDLNIVGRCLDFKNPLRVGDYSEVHEKFEVKNQGKINAPENWLEASFYTIRDYFLGGRAEFYDTKNVVVIDKKNNKVFTQEIAVDYSPEEEGGESLGGVCDVNNIKAINDSLFEVKSGAVLSFELYDSTKTIAGGAYYHYYTVNNDKLVELPDRRNFGFTKYVKMDDSYLSSCYKMLSGLGPYNKRKNETIDYVTPEMLRYMKNEIYAEYKYQFKDKRWMEIFADQNNYDGDGTLKTTFNASVDDSLTAIDKYNINWINQKLKGTHAKSNAIASK